MAKHLQFVVFRVGKELFGVNIASVQEIVRVPEVTQVPDAPDFLEGVINLRGRILPVVDLRKRLGLAAAEKSKTSRVLVTEKEGKVVGLLVDAASEVLRITADEIEDPPEMIAAIGVEYITAVAKIEERLVILLDLQKVLSIEDMKKMEAVHRRANSKEYDNLPETRVKGFLEEDVAPPVF